MGGSRGFETAAAEAGRVASDRKRVGRLVQGALNKAYRNRRWLLMVWVDLLALCRMVAAWSSGKYRPLPWKSLVLALAGILYFLNPIDISPDVIPGIGFLDDAGMLALVVNSIRNDLRRYLKWEAAGKPCPERVGDLTRQQGRRGPKNHGVGRTGTRTVHERLGRNFIMKIVPLNLADRGYRITIENGLLHKVGSLLDPWRSSSRLVVISSRPILDLHGEALQRSLSEAALPHEILEIPDGERYKTLSTLESIYKRLAGLGVNRRTPVVALGGGVVGDVAGFAAASYLRGLPCIQVPTTLVAQIDSAIGGKTGVNLSKGKNLVGAFYQPRAVFVDPELLLTLPRRELDSGLFEAIKYGVIADRKLYDQVVRQHRRAIPAGTEPVWRE